MESSTKQSKDFLPTPEEMERLSNGILSTSSKHNSKRSTKIGLHSKRKPKPKPKAKPKTNPKSTSSHKPSKCHKEPVQKSCIKQIQRAKKEVLSYIPGLARSIEHAQDIRFPALRSVLWDRRAEGEVVTVGADALIPRLVFRRAALASLYQRICSMQESPDTRWLVLSGLPISKLNANRVGQWVGGLWDVGVSACEAHVFEKMKRGFRSRRSGEICVVVSGSKGVEDRPAGFDAFGAEDVDDSVLEFSEEEYVSIIETLKKTLSVRGPPDPFEAVLVIGKAEVALRSDFDMPMSVQIRLEAFVPGISISCTPLSSVPILSTPLARKVLEWSSRSGSSVAGDDPTSSGFLTLNQTRKAVLLLEDDPLAYELPLVGIWLRGSCVGCQGKSWQSVVQDPAFMYTCLRYIHNDHIKERVYPQGAQSTTFLALLLGETAGPPVFLECTLSLSLQDEGSLACAHYESYVEADVSPLEEKFSPHEETIACDFSTVENLNARQSFRTACESVFPLETQEGDAKFAANDSELKSYQESNSRRLEEAGEELLEASIGDFLDAHESEICSSEVKSVIAATDTEEAISQRNTAKSLATRSASKYSELIVAQQEKLDRLQAEMQRLCHLIDDKETMKEESQRQVDRASPQVQNEKATAIYLQGLNHHEDPDESSIHPDRPISSITAARKSFTSCLIPEVVEEEESRPITPDPFASNISPRRSSKKGEVSILCESGSGSASIEAEQEANTIVSSVAVRMIAPEDSEDDEEKRVVHVEESISMAIPRIKVKTKQEAEWDLDDDEDDDSLAKIEQKYLRLAKQR